MPDMSSQIEIRPTKLKELLEGVVQRLEQERDEYIADALVEGIKRMRKRRWFGLRKPYWDHPVEPNEKTVNDYLIESNAHRYEEWRIPACIREQYIERMAVVEVYQSAVDNGCSIYPSYRDYYWLMNATLYQ